jgi:hypothetical protein
MLAPAQGVVGSQDAADTALLPPVPQMMRRLYGQLRAAAEADVARTLPLPSAAPALAPHEADLDAELDDAAQARVQRLGI